MNDNSYLDRILTEVEAARQDWQELFSGEFRIQEVFDLVGSLVRAAEAVIASSQSGAEKHRLVREAFEHFDHKYRIIDRIDDLIPLPFFLEPFDGPVIRKVVDFLIGQAVAVFNQTIWAKAEAGA
ncbi:MAG: hypothetical protein P9X24_18120 [Candidatus Hatepunaea meridiana]|nr:hypothetical protein [Candidatus Hatepunaea meridiana]